MMLQDSDSLNDPENATPSDTSIHFMWIFAADGLHLSAVCLLVGWVLHKKTCKGISGRTQIIGTLVDLLEFTFAALQNAEFLNKAPKYYSLSLSGISSAVHCVLMYVMYVKYSKTVEKDYDTFWIELLIILCGGFALVCNPVYMQNHESDLDKNDPLVVIYYSSKYLDSVSILPQIYFNFRTGSKNLCVSLYALLSSLSTFFYLYYLITVYPGVIREDINFDSWTSAEVYKIYPVSAQMGAYLLFFIMLVLVPKYEEVVPLSEVESTASSIDGEKTNDTVKIDPPVIIVTRPKLDRQQSLLETPFLKKTLPSSASLVSVNPDGAPRDKSPFQQAKFLRQNQNKPNISKIMKLTLMKRAQTSSSLFTLGAASAPSTPEDDVQSGFMMYKEMAIQSRQRRIEYNRRRSLPTTHSTSSIEIPLNGNTNDNLSNDKVKFQIGDEEDADDKTVISRYRKHRKTLSFERFLAAQKLKLKQAQMEESLRNTQNPTEQTEITDAKIHPSNQSDDDKIGNANLPSNPQPGSESELKKPQAKQPEETRKKSRRKTVYHPGSPQMHNNWKMLASNLIGTSSMDVQRRPSAFPLPSAEEVRVGQRRRNRIFSVV